MEVIKKLFIVDSTVISLFKDILKVAGRPRKDGKSKGGIKAHVMIHAAELMPCLIRFTEESGTIILFSNISMCPRALTLLWTRDIQTTCNMPNGVTEVSILLQE